MPEPTCAVCRDRDLGWTDGPHGPTRVVCGACTDWYVPSHDAAPVLPAALRDAIQRLDVRVEPPSPGIVLHVRQTGDDFLATATQGIGKLDAVAAAATPWGAVQKLARKLISRKDKR